VYGTNTISETAAPKGFVLVETPIQMIINGSQVDYEVEFLMNVKEAEVVLLQSLSWKMRRNR
jgi:uncharacterized surface anchored protein